ncbi:hypothetical protein [Paraburkholderia diazotrophica]|uniref:Uncharacterized protein n=1 Tax=Paraburkholderia diazotrophica TaxID=667676 RepID=A0A1H6UVW8_9BURK|nr:hypothetical protein [Paraburkholderia diazotrophica]SEI96391.1 hypothetical protein SAMN05192539_1005216 [Paraburkholderia diazotrophica]
MAQKRSTLVKTKLAQARSEHQKAITARSNALAALSKDPLNEDADRQLDEALATIPAWKARVDSLEAALESALAHDRAEAIAARRDDWRAARDKAVELANARAPILNALQTAIDEVAKQMTLLEQANDAVLLQVFEAMHEVEMPPSHEIASDHVHQQTALAARAVHASIEAAFAVALYDARVHNGGIDLSSYLDKWLNPSFMVHASRDGFVVACQQSAAMIGAAIDRHHTLTGVLAPADDQAASNE